MSDAHNKRESEEHKELWDKKLDTAGSAAGNMANIMQNLFVLTGSKNKAMFKVMKAFAIAETTVQTYRAAQGAYSAMASIPYVGPYLGVAAAAAAIASGLARVKQIQSMKPGGATGTISAGGSALPSYHGGSTNAYPAPQRIEEPLVQHVTVNIHNPLSEGNWDAISEDIVASLNRAGDRNVELTIQTTAA